MAGYNYKKIIDPDLTHALDKTKNWLQEQYMFIDVVSIDVLNSDEWFKVVVWYKSK